MEIWSTIIGLVRRPLVTVPALLLATVLAAVAYVSTGATYVSSTTMVLTMTEYGGTETEDPTEPTQLINPLLNFNGSLQTTSAILIQTMATPDVRSQLGVTEGGATQLVVNDGRTNPELLGLSGPFLYVEGRSTSEAAASRVVVAAQKEMRKQLSEWQRSLNAPQKTYLSLVDVVPPTAPRADTGRAVKLGVLAFLFGFVLLLASAYLGHRVRARRRARAAVVGDETAGGAVAADTGPPITVVTTAPRRTPRPAPDPAPVVATTPTGPTPVDVAAGIDDDTADDTGDDTAELVLASTAPATPGGARPRPTEAGGAPQRRLLPVPRKVVGRSRNR
jgi:hypothetical protein